MKRAIGAIITALSLLVTDALAQDDFSTRLDALWSFHAAATSEARFRKERAGYSPTSREALEASTQIARALGLQRKLADADRVLDAVERSIAQAPARVHVRYWLERGRVRNSSGHPADAVPLFKRALEWSDRDSLAGADYYRVDALHMLGIAAPPDESLDWNLRALTAADASADMRTRGWRGSLLNNIGWTFHDRGEYATALEYWQKALAAREAAGDEIRGRVAKWTVARGLRSLGRLDEAEAIQRALVVEYERLGEPDGYVFEELAEIALTRNDMATAKAWAAKAYAHLKDDAGFAAREQTRLQRLATIGGIAAKR